MIILSPNPNQLVVELHLDPMETTNSLSSTPLSNNSNTTLVSNSGSKVRKPYTITKSRENWTDEEHDKFLEALQLFNRDWKKVEAFVGSKTVIQIRSHAQKYFLKVQKSGTGLHVPPPRPKRKASRPYPQKASKTGAMLEDGYVCMPNSVPLPGPSYEVGLSRPVMTHNYSSSSSTESNQRGNSTCKINDQETVKLLRSKTISPDFSQVYRFIGSVFDPSEDGHLQKLKNMDPIDVETVLLFMENLTVNLLSPKFENYGLAAISPVNKKVRFLWFSTNKGLFHRT